MILVTGASGFIGKHLIPELLKKYKVKCIIRDNFDIQHKNLELMRGDITDTQTLEQAIKGTSIIIHLAAIIDPKNKDIENVNFKATKNLVELAKKYKIKKFIYLSTENVLYDSDDMYTITKRNAENLVKTFKNYTILRPTVIYGEYDQKYITKLIRFIKKYKIIPIPGSGKNLIQPVYVKDLVNVIINSIKYDIKGTFLIPGPSKITYSNLVDLITKELGIKRIKINIPMKILNILIYFYEKISKKPLITVLQLHNLELNRTYNLDAHLHLRYKPTPIEQGLKNLISTIDL